MTKQTIAPGNLGVKPSTTSFPTIKYDWLRQARVIDQEILMSKQTFDFNGGPKDTTSGSGNTIQTMDFNGKPKDCKAD